MNTTKCIGMPASPYSKVNIRGRLSVQDIVDVRLGTTPEFAVPPNHQAAGVGGAGDKDGVGTTKTASSAQDSFVDRCFTIVSRKKNLNLEFASEPECHEWYELFKTFMASQSSLKIALAIDEQLSTAPLPFLSSLVHGRHPGELVLLMVTHAAPQKRKLLG